ncbi:MAG: HAMP domain-containing histidine kinase [Prolixibacteraceae bacterium]|nr:HAMP domain-containing histidine kinase [Prolixibacteraceae bacterium]
MTVKNSDTGESTEGKGKVKPCEEKIDQLKLEIENLKKEVAKAKMFSLAVLSNLSHEIRTPLNGIMGFTEIIADPSISNQERNYYSDIITESSNMLLSIITDVLDISKIDSGTYRVYPIQFDLNDLMFQIYINFKPHAEKKELQLFLENVISTPFRIESDPAIIEKILKKLIDNALKFTKQGYVKFYYREEKNKIVFYVEDTGIGIREEIRESIFKKFTTQPVSQSRHLGGTGIDLSLCFGLVKLLGGDIKLSSKCGIGSVFSFSISNIK